MADQIGQFYSVMRLDKSRRRWRFWALFLIVLVFFMSMSKAPWDSFKTEAPYIANVPIYGMIYDTSAQTDGLAELAQDDAVKAVIISIDSPGGTMVGGIELYEALRELAKTKPVIAHLQTTAASAGYLTALGADWIVSNPATLTGSIGVYLPLIDASEAADTLGVKPDDIVSGKLKAITNPMQSRTPEGYAYLQSLVDSLNGAFYTYLAERRDMSNENIALLKDGRAVVGNQALELGLVDELGTLKTARAAVISKYNLPEDLEVIDVTIDEDLPWLEKNLFGALNMAVSKAKSEFLPVSLQVQSNPLAVWSILR